MGMHWLECVIGIIRKENKKGLPKKVVYDHFHNKLTLYKQAMRPVWSYGIQLWGCASDSNIQVIQR
jgi:hypothetical protein